MSPECCQAKVLAPQELEGALRELAQWTVHSGKLHREFLFKNFSEAFAFMTRAALLSEKHNHHPEWSNVYNRVVIDLVTHAAGGITELDLRWARAAEKMYLPKVT